MNLNFFKSTGLFAISGAYRSLCLVLLMPIWTKYLSPAEIGLFAIVMTYSQIISRIGNFGLNSSFTRFYIDYEDNKKRYSKFFSSVGLSLLLVTIVILSILLLTKDSLGSYLLNSENVYLWKYVWILYLTTLVTSLCVAMYVVEAKPKGAFNVTVIPQTLGIILGLSLVIYYSGGLIGRLDGLITGELVSAFVCLWILLKKYGKIEFSKDDVRDAWIFGAPLMIHSISTLLLQSGDRVILLKYSSEADVGKYTIATSLVAGMLMIQGAANQVWAPKFLRLLKLRDESVEDQKNYDSQFQKSFDYWMIGFSVLAIGLVLFGKQLVQLMTSDELYYNAAHYITPLAIGCLLTGAYFYGINIIMHTKKNKLIPVITASTGVLNIGLNIWLIPSYGPYAAAWTTLICNAVLLITVHFYARLLSGIKYQYNVFTILILIVIGYSVITNFIDYQSGVSLLLSLVLKLLLFLIFGYIGYKFYIVITRRRMVASS